MVSSRHAIAGFLLIAALLSYAHAQQAAASEKTASISGTVTFKGKGIAGIVVIANNPNAWDRERYRATTDQSGNYSIQGLPAGNYQIQPALGSLTIDAKEAAKSLMLSEGETVEHIDFSLARGGVITGRVTDADGQPLIEEQISILEAEPTSDGNTYQSLKTDDRGIYRAFGLRSGKDRVVNESGQPLANATVMIGRFDAVRAEQSAVSDREGKFEFTGLEPVPYKLSAKLASYIPLPRDLEVEEYRAGSTVTLRLIKGGVLTGTVTNEADEPIIGITVRARMIGGPDPMSLPYQFGRRRNVLTTCCASLRLQRVLRGRLS